MSTLASGLVGVGWLWPDKLPWIVGGVGLQRLRVLTEDRDFCFFHNKEAIAFVVQRRPQSRMGAELDAQSFEAVSYCCVENENNFVVS